MLALLSDQIYGTLPPSPDELSFAVVENVRRHYLAGKANLNEITVICTVNEKAFSFPFLAVTPNDGKPHPFFVHINFRPESPDLYMPTEELVDNGFAVLSFCYKDVTSDDGDFTNGLAGILFKNGVRKPNSPGKIAMWAWAAMRVMDWAETRPDLFDLSRSIVCGHSRLGKTALLCGAHDTRFAVTYSNDSGCGGASLARKNTGETVARICKNFPFWFCENYYKYADRETDMPFDQHWLLASIAPRRVLVGSASLDKWADPHSELLSCLAASPAFAHGIVCDGNPPAVGEALFGGEIGYHLRAGEHFFSRADWHQLIAFSGFGNKN